MSAVRTLYARWVSAVCALGKRSVRAGLAQCARCKQAVRTLHQLLAHCKSAIATVETCACCNWQT